MNAWRNQRHPLARAACVVIVALLVACHSWRVTDRPVSRVIPEDDPEEVRVTLSDRSVATFETPRLEGDSLVGRTWKGGPERSVALADVLQVEVRKLSITKTSLLTVGLGFTTLLVVAAIAEATDDDTRTVTGVQPSCPLVYSWDGESWRLDSGTFGGAILPSLARTDVDNLDHPVASPEGLVRLRVANELPETDFLDALSLLVVDHDPGITVSPASDGSLHAIGRPVRPLAARDVEGRDVLPRVSERDGWSWESALTTAAGTAQDARDGVVVEFERPASAAEARLVVDAHNTPWAAFLLMELLRARGSGLAEWYAVMDTDPTRAGEFFGNLARQAFLEIQLWTPDGWASQGLLWEAGPEIVKRQVVPLDLSGIGDGPVRVRLVAPASFWLIDHVAIDFGPEAPFTVEPVPLRSARDFQGGDVRPRIDAIDGEYLVMETGDAAEVSFRVSDAPAGTSRTYLLRSTGWYRVDARRHGEPDTALLERIEREPGAISRIARELRDQALTEQRTAR